MSTSSMSSLSRSDDVHVEKVVLPYNVFPVTATELPPSEKLVKQAQALREGVEDDDDGIAQAPRKGTAASSIPRNSEASNNPPSPNPLALSTTSVVLPIERYQYTVPFLASLVTTATKAPRLADMDGRLRKIGKRTLRIQKHLMQATQFTINGFFIFGTWWWSHYFWAFLPFITATVALNVVMVFSIAIATVRHRLWPEKKITHETPESLVLVLPCYNETKEELLSSLDSLVEQTGIDDHQRAIMIICDGNVRGPGMTKTTAAHLLEEILVDSTSQQIIKSAYTAWDQETMDVVVQKGVYGGLPYLCIVKEQNKGKRDGLIVVRSFLHNFNVREQQPKVIFSASFFGYMASFLLNDANITSVDHLVGMDADTVFELDCISELLKQSRFPGTVGVCGNVIVDFKGRAFSWWHLYQSAEYTISQGLRRLHQSIVTHKVSCLPGCCQMLRICEETCGEQVLIDLFGYCPLVTDNLLKQIRATASEDRNHVCIMLSARPSTKTRQALAARARTDVPQSWAVFLSQRRRWTLGATSNDLMLVTAPGVQWFERILALVNVLTWFLNPFILASLAGFISAIIHVPGWIILCFVAVMLIPILYYLCIPLWLCRCWLERFQFWIGCVMYVVCGPFINIGVLLYASYYMDDFKWGKTRQISSKHSVEEELTT